MATTDSPDRIAVPRMVAASLNLPGACSNARSLVSSADTTRNFIGFSALRLPRISPTQSPITWLLVRMYPPVLIKKPVPLTSTSFLGLAGGAAAAGAAAADCAGGACAPAAGGFETGVEKSPALDTPAILVLVTQLAMTGRSWPVEVRVNCRTRPVA